MSTEQIIDAHHHLWDLNVRDQPWTHQFGPIHRSFTVPDLRSLLDRNGVTGTVLVQTLDIADETADLLTMAEDEPILAGVVGWTSLDAPDIADRISRLRSLRGGDLLVGIRHGVQSEPDPRWLCRPEVRRGLAAVASAGLVFDLLVTAAQLPAVVETVRALPALQFVLDHAGNPPVDDANVEAAWRRDLVEVAGAGNVAVKLSGLVTRGFPGVVAEDTLESWAELLFDSFGPARVMFGSDWPVCTLNASYDDVLGTARRCAADLSDAERRAVFGGTARRVYRLRR